MDPSQLPCLALSIDGQVRVLKSYNSQSQWVLEGPDGEQMTHHLQTWTLAKLDLRVPYEHFSSPVWKLIRHEIFQHQRTLVDVALSGVMLNVVALAISFYSMQVYDRVVPTASSATLWVLSLGVLGARTLQTGTVKDANSVSYDVYIATNGSPAMMLVQQDIVRFSIP
jgi:ATP-binding cassette subfamily C protein LapB